MITHEPAKRCDTSASVREIQRALRRYRGVRGVTEIAILRDRISAYRNICRANCWSRCRGLRQSNSVRCGADGLARDRRQFLTPQLIGRDFSGLTLTFGKPGALNSSVNRAFVTFVVFFTSN
jgi:hypothetical protein